MRLRLAAILIITAVACIALFLTGAFRVDDPDYARFAGSRDANVYSNAGFAIVGAIGIAYVMKHRRQIGDDDAAALTTFIGVLLTAFGSAWFHLEPLANGVTNKQTLLWDRLPMTIAFAGLIALVLRDRVFDRSHNAVLTILLVVGIGTVVWWYATDQLFPYAFFQLFAAAAPLLLLMTLRGSHTESGYVLAGIVLFGVAKLFEGLDAAIYERTSHRIAGHPLKHIAGAFAALTILIWLAKRLTPPAPPHPPR